MDSFWTDPAAAWWAKAARARAHIDTVTEIMLAYQRSEPYEIVREAGHPGRRDFRLHVREPVPTVVLTTIGDVLHNLRSCLDSVAFELARRHLNDRMTDKQERAAQFPICRNPAEFDEFLSKQRRAIWGAAEIAALRCAQPFGLHEQMTAMGAELATSLDDEYRISELARLNRLSNLDKHRRLPLLAWYTDIIYGPGFREDCCWIYPKEQRLSDGDLVGTLTWASRLDDPSAGITIDLKLALADDPGYTDETSQVLAGMHGTITTWILPRIFYAAAGSPPPLALIHT